MRPGPDRWSSSDLSRSYASWVSQVTLSSRVWVTGTPRVLVAKATERPELNLREYHRARWRTVSRVVSRVVGARAGEGSSTISLASLVPCKSSLLPWKLAEVTACSVVRYCGAHGGRLV